MLRNSPEYSFMHTDPHLGSQPACCYRKAVNFNIDMF